MSWRDDRVGAADVLKAIGALIILMAIILVALGGVVFLIDLAWDFGAWLHTWSVFR